MNAVNAGIGVEWIILADRAEVINNKLYLMGGGWDVITVGTQFPVVHHCALAISFKVPWNETNQRHTISIEIVDEDGQTSLAKVGGQIEVGRPVGIRPGQSQRLQMGINIPLEFAKAGAYEVTASIEGQHVGGTEFRVLSNPT
jgi:hypothetical protein